MASLPPPVDFALAGAMQEWFVWLHRHPELSFQERETAAFVATTLRHLGYAPRERVGVGPAGEPLHGVVAVLGAERAGPALALRADMDALPLTEASGLPYSSTRPGVMHACGHDAHTAMLLGAAAPALKAQDERHALPGPVVLLFQPAEEVPPGGALGMIEAGVLEDPPVGAVFGLHQSTRDVGTFSIAAGPRNAASDGFRITVTGRGGHAAWPQRTVDPILVAAHIVVALQGIVSRQIAPRQAAVLTVGVIEGGTKENVIPETVHLRGTVRTLDEDVREQMPGRIRTIAEGIAAFGATVDVDYRRGYDVLINDPEMSVLASRAAADVVGEGRIQPAEAGMGGEDFGRYLLKVPGCFATIGAGTPEVPQDERVGGHSPRFALDPACLPYGVAWYVAVVRRYFALRSASS